MNALRMCLPVCLVAALIGGCQSRLRFEQVSRVEVGEVKSYEVDGPKYEQKVAIDVNSDQEIAIYIVASKDKDATFDDLAASKEPKNVLAFKENIKVGSFEATVPARDKFVVFVAKARKTAQVTIKIAGK